MVEPPFKGSFQLTVILSVDCATVVNKSGAEGTVVVVTEKSEESALAPLELTARTLKRYVS